MSQYDADILHRLVSPSPSSTDLMFNPSLPDTPHGATQALAENAVHVRDAAKWIGRAMVKLGQPRSVLVVAKAFQPSLIYFQRELARHLIHSPTQKQCDRIPGLNVYVESTLRDDPLFDYSNLVKKYPHYREKLLFWTPELCATHADKVDFIITLGGDGTVLYAAWLFQNTQVPPVIPFHLGSLGFLTVFNICNIKSVLERFIGCSSDGVRVNMRMRLSCTVWRSNRKMSAAPVASALYNGLSMESLSRRPSSDTHHSSVQSPDSLINELGGIAQETFQILNDLVVDRGPSAYMSQLELFVDDKHLTTVQADGLVIATPTGSTAYSLSAGGSVVHPEVPSFLISPICAHTLSFRPMLLPDSVELKIQVPLDSRTTAWASFDGRHRIELHQGDYIAITMSRLPMPSVCMNDQSSDWFESLRRCLHWNQRTRQKGLNPAPIDSIADLDEPELSLEDLANKILKM